AKILPPPPGDNAPELYGAVTADAANYVEIQSPNRRRVYSLAVTARWQTTPGPGERSIVYGQPSSWSATLDALAVGRRVLREGESL
ncbi:hypothetical protein QNA19_24175, partial [Rhodococcus fascians]